MLHDLSGKSLLLSCKPAARGRRTISGVAFPRTGKNAGILEFALVFRKNARLPKEGPSRGRHPGRKKHPRTGRSVLLRPEQPVPRVSEARHDVGVVVEVVVEGGGVDGDRRVGGGEDAHALGCGDQGHERGKRIACERRILCESARRAESAAARAPRRDIENCPALRPIRPGGARAGPRRSTGAGRSRPGARAPIPRPVSHAR